MAPVLRPKHTLKGRSVVPLIKRLRNGGDIAALARLARDVDPEEMSRRDLMAAITRLTGERQPADLWQMAGKGDEPTDDDLRIVLHHTITLANELGQPLEVPQPDVSVSFTSHVSLSIHMDLLVIKYLYCWLVIPVYLLVGSTSTFHFWWATTCCSECQAKTDARHHRRVETGKAPIRLVCAGTCQGFGCFRCFGAGHFGSPGYVSGYGGGLLPS